VSARPVDWSPLADSDPIGGDVDAVHSEARYYTDLAQEISDQVDRLRRIAAHDEQLGKTADKLRSAAGKTAHKLAKTHGRVEAVGSALTAWVPHLATAQADTLTALRAAQDAATTQQRNAPPPPGAPAPKTDADKHDEAMRHKNYASAGDALSAAQAKFQNAIDERDRQASLIAKQINHSLHDGLKDGFWDHVSNWVSQNVKMIKKVVEILSWVATAVAILAICCTGVGVLAAAMVLTGAVLLGHTLLAATGNGSWVDVGIDAFALFTLNAGHFAGTAAKAARGLALGRAGGLAAADAADTVNASRAVLRQEYQAAAKGFGKFTSRKGFRAWRILKSGDFDTETAAMASRAADDARAAVRTRELPRVTVLESYKALGRDFAEHMRDLKALRAIYGSDAQFGQIADRWGGAVHRGQRFVGAGQTVDLANHGLDTARVPAWESFKEHVVMGDSWARPGE
jgi:hypothetical protein